MATKSFLTSEQMIEASGRLLAPIHVPDGDEKKRFEFGSREFSRWLSEKLQARLETHPEWLKAGPIALGSWARGELCPKSDIDVLFCGEESSVRAVVSDFAREGVKLRSRMPENPSDWTKGVLPFDILALQLAVPLSPLANEKLAYELARLSSEMKTFRKSLLMAMRKERESRAQRYDSIASFLEPNLKFGPGGLRDLEQALVTRKLFPERFLALKPSPRDGLHSFDVLSYYKDFLLLVRQKLHLSDGSGDVLSAPEQKPISDWLGFENPRDFMREIQKGVSRVSFYADWIVAQASQSKARVTSAREAPLKTASALFDALEKDPSVLMQNQVRLVSDSVFEKPVSDRLIGQALSKFLDPAADEDAMIALFRSRLIDKCVPEFRKIVGYVQHDQYHRFSVDAHLLQVLRELKRLRQKPGVAGKLKPYVKRLSNKEWEVLAFAGLFHDIAKGRGGDHAVKGLAIAKRDLKRFGKSEELIRDVCWIVEEHLLLSAAAFRENPRSPRTWRALMEKDVKDRRLLLLTVFTIADIRATNPDAWTPWKERLMAELVSQLEKPETDQMMLFGRALKSVGHEGWDHYVDALDPFLISSLSPKKLASDLKRVASSKTLSLDEAPLVLRVTGGKGTWIRFHSSKDKPGLFLRYVDALVKSGLSVRHASIHTDPTLGVYDWFEVKSTKTPAQISKLLGMGLSSETSVKKTRVEFDSIDLVGSDASEWVISFRGRDQSGALATAVRALFECEAQVRWAKVHTWGRQLDDIFGVAPLEGGPEPFLQKLKTQLGATPQI